MKKLCLILFLLSITKYSYSGINGLTHHSRANCVNNETISWDLTHYYWLCVRSKHTNIKTGEQHTIYGVFEYTWRSAAVHWGEGKGDWIVDGEHYMIDKDDFPYEVQNETVDDCSIYDGWWDQLIGEI